MPRIASGSASSRARRPTWRSLLLSPAHYVVEALSPYADVREMRTVPATAVPKLIEEGANVLVLADIGGLDADTRGKLDKFLADGGVIIRFAGTRLAAAPADELTPVRLRGGGRLLGGVLSWDTPKTLAPFARRIRPSRA